MGEGKGMGAAGFCSDPRCRLTLLARASDSANLPIWAAPARGFHSEMGSMLGFDVGDRKHPYRATANVPLRRSFPQPMRTNVHRLMGSIRCTCGSSGKCSTSRVLATPAFHGFRSPEVCMRLCLLYLCTSVRGSRTDLSPLMSSSCPLFRS